MRGGFLKTPHLYAGLAQLGRASALLNELTIYYDMMNSKEIGNLTELQCITNLYALGCNVSLPFGNSQKYDLILEYKNKLYKVQVKHANATFENGKIAYFTFKTRWQSHNQSGYAWTPYTEEDIPNPLSVYGKTKLEGEQEVFRVKPNSFVVRTSWVFGVANNNFNKQVINWSKSKDELSIVDDQISSPT